MVRCVDQAAYDAALETIGKGVVFGIPATRADIDPELVPELMLILELDDYALTGPLTHELQSLRGNQYPDIVCTEVDDNPPVIATLDAAAIYLRAKDAKTGSSADAVSSEALADENKRLKAQIAKMRAG